ncbi:MAG: hypothetical protein WDA00_02165 [Eubacteriales bacterium]
MGNYYRTKEQDKKLILTILLCVVILASATVTIVLLVKKSHRPDDQDLYPTLSLEPNAELIDEGGSTQAPLTNPEGGGAVGLTYSNQATAPRGDGVASILFRNPAKSNQGIIIQLQITDRELIDKLGKTGRTAEEKALIEDAEGYDSETSRMMIAESGLLEPGYQLATLSLQALPDGTVLPAGTYQAVFYILAYDKTTHERAIVNIQLPIVLTIED